MEEGVELLIEGFNDEELQSIVEGLTTERELVERLVKIVDVGFVDSHKFNAFAERLERFFINDVSFLISLPKESSSLTDEDKLLWKYQVGNIYIKTKEDKKSVELRNIFERLNLQVMTIQFGEHGVKYGLIDLEKGQYDIFINQIERYKKWYIRAIEKLSPELEDLKVEMRTDIEAAYAGNEVRENPFFKWLIFTEHGMGLTLNFKFEGYHQKGVKVMVAKTMTVDLPNIDFIPKLAENHIFKYCQFRRNEIEIAKQSVPPMPTSTDANQEKKGGQKKEIYISPENIEPIYNALAPYFQKQETGLRRLLEGETIEERLNWSKNANQLTHVFWGAKRKGWILDTNVQICEWILRNFRYNNGKTFDRGSVTRDLNTQATRCQKPLLNTDF